MAKPGRKARYSIDAGTIQKFAESLEIMARSAKAAAADLKDADQCHVATNWPSAVGGMIMTCRFVDQLAGAKNARAMPIIDELSEIEPDAAQVLKDQQRKNLTRRTRKG